MASPYWDPIWEAAQEMNFPLHFHAREGVTVGGEKLPYEGRKKSAAWLTMGALTQFELAAELLFSGLYERVPRVRVGHVEGNVGWVPYMLERADQVFAQHRFWTRPPITMPALRTLAAQLLRHVHPRPRGCGAAPRHRRRKRHVELRLPPQRHPLARIPRSDRPHVPRRARRTTSTPS